MISNKKEVIAYVYESSGLMRFFSIGMGTNISPYLIQNIAKAGRGDYDFVKDDENIETKTKYLIQSSISPLLKDI